MGSPSVPVTRRLMPAVSRRLAVLSSATTRAGLPMDRLDTVRIICLAYPEATEELFGGHGQPTFRVRGRIFAMFVDNHHGDGRLAIWCKAAPGGQDVLVAANPERYFVPPYVGPRGWVGMRLEGTVDWDEVRALVDESYRLIAPKRLVARLAGAPGVTQPRRSAS